MANFLEAAQLSFIILTLILVGTYVIVFKIFKYYPILWKSKTMNTTMYSIKNHDKFIKN